MTTPERPNRKQAHEEAQRLVEAKREAEIQRLAEIYASVFNSHEGRVVLNDLISRVGLLNAVPAGESSLQYLEGKRAVVCHLLAMLKRAAKEEIPTITLPL